MAGSAVVRARIDEKTKYDASAELATMGLIISDAFRLLMVRIAKGKARPFEPLTPDAETVRAMKKARRVKVKSFKGVDDLITELNAKNCAHQDLHEGLSARARNAQASRP